MLPRLLASLWIALLLTACLPAALPPSSLPTTPYVLVTVNPDASPTPTPFQPVQEPRPTATLPIPSPTPTATISNPPAKRAQYQLTVTLDYAAHTLDVDEMIRYPNLSGEVLPHLILAVEPNRWPGCFTLNLIQVNGQAAPYNLSGGWLEVTLNPPLSPDETATLHLQYRLVMPWAHSNQIFGYNNWQLNAVDWYPFVIPYAPGQGWLQHEPSTVGEHLVYDIADFEVTIHLADKTTNVLIAASAPANGDRYRLSGGRNFVFSASPYFLTTSTTAAGVTITSYYFEAEKRGGEAIASQVAKALTTYSALFVPFPYPSLSIVEAIYPDGMEYCGLFFLNRSFYASYDGTALNNLVAIGVHEAAHNWWYGLVGNDQALEPWLDEALATYSEWIFYENNYPSLGGAWWNFRVNAFDPAGWVNATIYNGGEFRPYTNAVYLQGARFLHALRIRMGEEAFFSFLRDWATSTAYRRGSSAEFFDLARQHSPTDFSDLIEKYFHQ